MWKERLQQKKPELVTQGLLFNYEGNPVHYDTDGIREVGKGAELLSLLETDNVR
jgi:hypothetical protein